MRLNSLSSVPGSTKKPKRVGRGVGSGLGKTAGRGHKGQRARAGGFHKIGFEGGQMPLHRRLPKIGFSSHISATRAEVRLNELAKLATDSIDLDALKAANIVPKHTQVARVIKSGALTKAVNLKGLKVTAGARAVIEKLGGKVEE